MSVEVWQSSLSGMTGEDGCISASTEAWDNPGKNKNFSLIISPVLGTLAVACGGGVPICPTGIRNMLSIIKKVAQSC